MVFILCLCKRGGWHNVFAIPSGFVHLEIEDSIESVNLLVIYSNTISLECLMDSPVAIEGMFKAIS